MLRSLIAISVSALTPLLFGETPPEIAAKLDAGLPKLVALYQELHATPELSFQEINTAARFTSELKGAGFDVTPKVGGHGVVGVLHNGAGPTVLLRTELDALPVLEKTRLPYASAVRAKDDKGADVPVMHACGHDIHITCSIAAARLLSGLRPLWRGTLVIIGQPAEERVGGAKAMLADGLFTRFPRPDYCVALHCAADLAAGRVGVVEGFALASSDAVDLVIKGVGGHGAWPQKAKDPIVLSAQIVLALQTIVSRETKPGEPNVVTIGSIHGGTKHNIIPDEVRLQLTLRSYSDEVRERTIASIRRIVRGQALAADIPDALLPTLTVIPEESAKPTYNDPALTQRLAAAGKRWLGSDNIETREPVMGSEDFGLYGRTAEKIPIAILWLGTVSSEAIAESKASGTPLPPLHSAYFAPLPEPSIKTGAAMLISSVLELAGAPK